MYSVYIFIVIMSLPQLVPNFKTSLYYNIYYNYIIYISLYNFIKNILFFWHVYYIYCIPINDFLLVQVQ